MAHSSRPSCCRERGSCQQKFHHHMAETHQRTNASCCYGNRKIYRSLKFLYFEPKIFLGKIFRVRPRSTAGKWPRGVRPRKAQVRGLAERRAASCPGPDSSPPPQPLGRGHWSVFRAQAPLGTLLWERWPWKGKAGAVSRVDEAGGALAAASLGSRARRGAGGQQTVVCFTRPLAFGTAFAPEMRWVLSALGSTLDVAIRQTNFKHVKLQDGNGFIKQNLQKPAVPDLRSAVLRLHGRALFPCDRVAFPLSALSPSADLQAEAGVHVFRRLREVRFFCRPPRAGQRVRQGREQLLLCSVRCVF